MACNELTRGINPNCDALRKAGGLNKRVYIGLLSDLTSVTFAETGQITGFTFAANKGFVKFIGKKEKHNTAMTLEVGESFTLRNHAVNLVAYYSTAEELTALDSLIDVEGLFMVAETNNGELEVWGVNNAPNWANFGLTAASLQGGSGTAILDPNIYTLGFTGNHENLQKYFVSNPVTPSTLAEDIAILEAQVIWPAPPAP